MALPLVQVRIAGSKVVWRDETGGGGEAPVGRGWPEALRRAAADARDRLWRLHGGDRYRSGARVTLAVYVEDPDDRLGPVPDELEDSVTRVERLPPPGRRPPATLPLRVVAATPEAVWVSEELGRHDGILPAPPGPDWWRLPADVLVTSRRPTRAPTHRARLVLAPPDTAPEPWMDALLHLDVDLAGAREAVEEVMAGITHDLPLHDALRQAIEHRALPPDTRLWASPESDQGLRISLVAARLAEDALVPPRAPQAGRPRGVVPEGLGSDDLPIPEVMYRARRPLAFDRESAGLRTLASTVRAMAIAPRRALLGLTGRSRSSRRPAARREADLRLLRPPALVSARAHQGQRTVGDLAWVGRRTTLMAGQVYRLRFQIGASFPGNLLSGPSPDFDALLAREPAPAGHELTVVLYPQDFRSVGDGDPAPVVRPLLLPSSGPSEALLFPVIPARLGRLQLRLSVYHRGSMLASYRLRARVTEAEHDGRAAIDARCDYTRGDAFADPRPDEARDLHLAVNRSGGAHDLMVLDPAAPHGPEAADTRVTVTALGDFLAEARRVLRPMAESPVYRLHLPATAPPARLAGDLHALATLGRSLLTGLLYADRTLQPAFRRVSEGRGLYLQAVRHPGAPALPWALVYDWKVPATAPATVCLGVDATGKECAHDRSSLDVVCARGFWGIRHRVEERVDNRSDWPGQLPPGGVTLALDPDGPHWKAFGLVPPPDGVTLLPPEAPIVSALDAPDRAPVFGILGHHAVAPAPGGGAAGGGGNAAGRPTVSQVEVGPKQRAVRLNDLLDLQLDSDWAGDGRRPLILLMACETAVGQEEDVYVDYQGPLFTLGAAGVVSTQTVVGYDLLGWTTRRLVDRLLGGAPLATALRDVRAALLRERNCPLGFLLTAVANGDLHLPPGPP